MAGLEHPTYFRTFRKSSVFLLAVFWTLGLGCGGYFFRLTGSNLASQMPLAAMGQPSIFGLLISFVLPFLCSAFAVYISASKLLFLIAFAKAVLFGFVTSAVCTAFGSAGWLVRVLLLFTDIGGVIFLFHYWVRHISGFRPFSAGAFVAYLVPVFCIVLADYYYISPLLQRVLV